MTPVEMPALLGPEFRGCTCTAVLAHVGSLRTAGHWLAFVKSPVTGWWRVDSERDNPGLEDPWQGQAGVGQRGYTLNMFWFS